MFSSSLIPEICGSVFLPPPPDEIWQWAESTVWLEGNEAAEPGFYRSAKTPWARRLQEVFKHPVMLYLNRETNEWAWVPVTAFNIQKSSQSGFTEGILNGARWRAKYKPANLIYAINSNVEARNISDRLIASIKRIDSSLFTGDSDDEGALKVSLASMDMWFMGSFSPGSMANKQAAMLVSDEYEEHAKTKGDTSSATNLDSRGKTADYIHFTLSKPKRPGGPINKKFLEGNQERYHIRCPACGTWQPMTMHSKEMTVPFSAEIMHVEHPETGKPVATFRPLAPGETRKYKTGRFVFSHCKTLLGDWDELRMMRETEYECGHCQHRITEDQKSALRESALWLPTAHGALGTISQLCTDFLSDDKASAWGRLMSAYIKAKRAGYTELQGWWNHRAGEAFAPPNSKATADDISSNIGGQVGDFCPPYRRGTVPFLTFPEQRRAILVLGGDVGGNYAKYAVGVLAPNMRDVAFLDWGEEISPDGVAEIILTKLYPFAAEPDGKPFKITIGFIDAKYRKGEVWKACLSVPGRRFIPCSGSGNSQSVKLFQYVQIPNYPRGFCRLDFNDRDAKDETYIYRLKQKERRIWFPTDVMADREFVAEVTAENLITDPDTGETEWDENPPPNHFGDCVKNAITGVRYYTRLHA